MPQKANFRLQKPMGLDYGFLIKRADLWPVKDNFRLVRTHSRPARADLRIERADFRPLRAYLSTEG